jgi:hypothetical protein
LGSSFWGRSIIIESLIAPLPVSSLKYGIKPFSSDHFIGSTALYETYEKWCSKNRHKPLDHKPFARKLTASNITRKRSQDGNLYGINADSTIFEEISTC